MRTFCLFLVLATTTLTAPGTPKTMTKIEAHLEGPQVMADSFSAKPKVIYRADTRYCRLEEAQDTENKIHGLLIVNEPDAWMVNLYNKSAQHMVDPGPTFNCKLPIIVSYPFSQPWIPKMKLESSTKISNSEVNSNSSRKWELQVSLGQTKMARKQPNTPLRLAALDS